MAGYPEWRHEEKKQQETSVVKLVWTNTITNAMHCRFDRKYYPISLPPHWIA